MTPLYFNDCFGWLHHASGSRGVVICSAHGVEELCTHRFMRHLADQLSSAGIPALRFDYHGTGDSIGSDSDPQRVQHWLDSVKQAIACLKAHTGVSEVALVGFRIGALLAGAVAAELGDIPLLALLAPAVSGKSYLREMKALGIMIDQAARAAPPADVVAAQSDADTVVAGFRITADTKAALQQIDLMTLQHPPARRVMVLGRPNAPADTRLAQHLTSLGSAVTQGVLPGYAQMQWDTSFAELPSNAFSELVRWLAQDLSPPLIQARVVTPNAGTLSSTQWHEQPVRFGPAGMLFAIRCQPVTIRPQQQQKLVIFVNHGSNHHIGWARMYVWLARRFAAFGIASLRIDIAGVGDSPARPRYAENVLYARHSQYDVYAALDWARGESYESISLIGHCAGAYLSFYSTLRDPRVSNLVMLNLQRFFWARGDLLQAASQDTYRSSDWYWSMVRDPQIWRRLLTGKINVRGITLTLMQRILQRGHGMLISVFGPLLGKEGLSGKVVRWLRELSARGTRVLLVYSAEDGGLDEFSAHAGSHGRKVRKLANIEFQIIDGADHNLTPQWSQERYIKILEKFLTD